MEHTAVVQGDDRHSEVGSHDGGWVHDVFEQVIEVVATGAGDVRADGGPFAEQCVAGGAEGREKDAALTLVGGGERGGGEFCLEAGNELSLGCGGVVDVAPNLAQLAVECRVLELAN